MTPTILVVDDEEDILSAMKDLLEGVMDVPITLATTGSDGLRALQERDVVLVIADFRMPGMDGLEFLARSFQMRPGVPRIMMTAFPDIDLVVQAVNQARITQFLLKPLQPESLIETVKGILAEHPARPAHAAGRRMAQRPSRPRPDRPSAEAAP